MWVSQQALYWWWRVKYRWSHTLEAEDEDNAPPCRCVCVHFHFRVSMGCAQSHVPGAWVGGEWGWARLTWRCPRISLSKDAHGTKCIKTSVPRWRMEMCVCVCVCKIVKSDIRPREITFMNVFQIPTLSSNGTKTISRLRPSSFTYLENFYSYCNTQLICPPY